MDNSIITRMIEKRTACGLSQGAVAEKLGISRQAVSKWERGDSLPSFENYIAISKLYGTTPDELLIGGKRKNPKSYAFRPDAKLGERITQMRKEEGLSQGDIAKKLNVSRQAVSKWENGDAQPDVDGILVLAEIYRASLSDFLPSETLNDATAEAADTVGNDSEATSEDIAKKEKNRKQKSKTKIEITLPFTHIRNKSSEARKTEDEKVTAEVPETKDKADVFFDDDSSGEGRFFDDDNDEKAPEMQKKTSEKSDNSLSEKEKKRRFVRKLLPAIIGIPLTAIAMKLLFFTKDRKK